MRTYKARVKIGGSSEEVTVQADSELQATRMLEAQYGKGCIVSSPLEIR